MKKRFPKIGEAILAHGFWFIAGIILAIILAVAIWLVGQTYGDPKIATIDNLGTATGFTALNLILVFWSLPREPFASNLLLVATVISEILIVTFLWLG